MTETGVEPILEDWEQLVTPEEINTKFVVIDVPCEESVFSKMIRVSGVRAAAAPRGVRPASGNGNGYAYQPFAARVVRGQYELLRLPSNGVVTLHDPATGSFTYEPKSGFSGGDNFSFIVLKGEIRSSEGVVQIAIKAGESDPGDPEPFLLDIDRRMQSPLDADQGGNGTLKDLRRADRGRNWTTP